MGFYNAEQMELHEILQGDIYMVFTASIQKIFDLGGDMDYNKKGWNSTCWNLVECCRTE